MHLALEHCRNRGSSASTVSDYRLDDRANGVRSPAEAKDFPLASSPRPSLRPTQPPLQWKARFFSGGQVRRGMTIITYPLSSTEVMNELDLHFVSPFAPVWRNGRALLLLYLYFVFCRIRLYFRF
jgi:hypothetical protein